MGIAKSALKALGLAARNADAAQTVPMAEDGSNPYSRRERFVIADLVFSYLPEGETFSILDGGARGGPSDPRWRSIADQRLVIHGFEVDTVECARLNQDAARQGLRHHYYPIALWSSNRTLTVHQNKASGGGSVYRQNVALTNRWKFQNVTQKFYARDIFYPTTDVSFAATKVDAWACENRITQIDFLKLNVQGAELEILDGATEILNSVLGLQVEMSFVESYVGRPLFSDIDTFVRQRGFHFFDLVGLHYMGRADSPVTSMHTPGLYPLYGQLIEALGVYFRDPIAAEELRPFTPEQVLKLAAISEIYGQVAYAFELLGWLSHQMTETGDFNRSRKISQLREDAVRLYHQYLGAPFP